MAVTYPYAGGWSESFAAVTTSAARDVGSGANRKAVAIVTYRGGSPTFPVPTTFSVGADSIPTVGSTFTEATGNKWQLFVSTDDLTVSGSQTCSAAFSGGGGGPGGIALVALLIVKGDAAITIANILALLEQSVGGGGGNTSRTITSTAGQTAIRMLIEWGGVTGTATSPATLITSANSGKWFAERAATSTSTVIGMDWGAFAEMVGTGFTVSEAGGSSAVPIFTQHRHRR